MKESEGEIVIDLLEILRAFIKNLWLILVLTAVGAALSFGYTFAFVKPLYKSSALLYVNNSDVTVGNITTISSGNLTAAKSLVATYSVILKSRTVVNEVMSLSNTKYTYEQMVSMVEAKAVDNTEGFTVTVTSTNPLEAEELANLYAQVLPEKIGDIVTGSDIKVIDYAVVATKRSSPSYSKNTMIGAAVGFLLAAGIIVLIYLKDDIIHSEDYLSKTYPTVPLLAVVPDLVKSRSNGYGYYKVESKNENVNNSTELKQVNPFTFDKNKGSDGED